MYAHNHKTSFGSLWDVETGTLKLSPLPGTRFDGFLPDNNILIGDDNQHIEYMLQIDTGRQATLFENLDAKASIFPATPDGTLFVWWENFETLHFYGIPAESKSTL